MIFRYTSKIRSDEDLDDNRVFNPQHEQQTVIYAFVLGWRAQTQVELKSVKATDKVILSLIQ